MRNRMTIAAREPQGHGVFTMQRRLDSMEAAQGYVKELTGEYDRRRDGMQRAGYSPDALLDLKLLYEDRIQDARNLVRNTLHASLDPARDELARTAKAQGAKRSKLAADAEARRASVRAALELEPRDPLTGKPDLAGFVTKALQESADNPAHVLALRLEFGEELDAASPGDQASRDLLPVRHELKQRVEAIGEEIDGPVRLLQQEVAYLESAVARDRGYVVETGDDGEVLAVQQVL